jgi:RNA polymerase sigma factor (sigma-70 family)
MNVKIHPKNLELLRTHHNLIDRQVQKIRKTLHTYSSEVVDLDVTVAKLTRGSQYQTSMVLALPQRSIRVEEVEDNPTSSIVRAFAELRRRINRFKSQLTRERLWRREPLRTWTESAGDTSQVLGNSINQNLEKIENYIRRELYHNVVTGILPPGHVEPHALVDDVFLEVTSNIHSRPPTVSVEQWMFQMARERIRELLEEVEKRRDDAHIEELVETTPQWEDELLNFYQPDESLHLEDLVRDNTSADPEQLLEREEVEERIQEAIAHLPAVIRESFVLFAVEGFTSDEVAMITGKKSGQVLDDVETARETLRKRLSL